MLKESEDEDKILTPVLSGAELSSSSLSLFSSVKREDEQERETGERKAMRIIVPLQGVVQGRGGLFLGSVIPCALFYFWQLYLKRNRSSSSSPPSASPPSGPSPSTSANDLPELVTGISRSLSRTLLSPKGSFSPAQVSSRASSIIRSGESACYVGFRRAAADSYDPVSNPEGVIQLGLAENTVILLQGFVGVFGVWDGEIYGVFWCSCRLIWLENGWRLI